MQEEYYVDINGTPFGPATPELLAQWVDEGRVGPNTLLINAATRAQIPASQLPALADRFGLGGSGAAAETAAQPRLTEMRVPLPPNLEPQTTSYPNTPPTPGMYAGPVGVQQRTLYGGGAASDVNDSGTGATAQLPAELKGLNWGAFLIPFWWSISNKTYLGLLCLVPYVGWIMSVVLLFQGNQWAWQNRRFEGTEEFKAVQKAWVTWGLGILAVSFVIGIIAALAGIGRR